MNRYYIAFLFFLLPLSTATASIPAEVISIPKGAPVFVADGVKTTTIVRGMAANDPARVVVQFSKKGNFLKNFRLGMIKNLNPYYLGALAASGFIVDALFDLQADLYKPAVAGSVCTGSKGFVGFGTTESCVNDYVAHINDFYGYGGSGEYYAVESVKQLSPTTLEVLMYKWITTNNGPYYSGQFKSNLNFGEQQTEPVRVTDDELWEFAKDYVQQNPTINHNDMFKNAEAQPNPDFFENVQYNPAANEDDLALLDLYRQGLLQSDDPTAPYYVPPEKLAEIAALDAQIAKEQTPEGEADAINDKLDQPITQAQYEESNANMAMDATNAVETKTVDNMDKTQELDEQFNILDNLVHNPVDLPSALPSLQLPQSTSSCKTIEINHAGHSVTFPNASQCNKLNEAKQGIGYLLYLLTFMGICFALLRSPN